MADVFVGSLMLVPYNFAPKGFALCAGQLLPISQNTALFSLLGTQYGGDGKVTFALPDLRGRVTVGKGQGPGLSMYDMGEMAGTATETLITQEVPPHTHTLQGNVAPAAQTTPAGNSAARGGLGVSLYSPDAQNAVAMNPQALTPAGGSMPHNNVTPSQALNWIIALQGVFPARG